MPQLRLWCGERLVSAASPAFATPQRQRCRQSDGAHLGLYLHDHIQQGSSQIANCYPHDCSHSCNKGAPPSRPDPSLAGECPPARLLFPLHCFTERPVQVSDGRPDCTRIPTEQHRPDLCSPSVAFRLRMLRALPSLRAACGFRRPGPGSSCAGSPAGGALFPRCLCCC